MCRPQELSSGPRKKQVVHSIAAFGPQLCYLNRAPSAGPAHLPPSVISVLINLSKKEIKMIASKLSFAVCTFQLPSRSD